MVVDRLRPIDHGSRILVLFDIDGTLILTGGAGLRGMNAAFATLHNLPTALDGVPVAGRTDRAILTEVFTREGLDVTDEHVVALREAYLAHLPAALQTPGGSDFGVLPGVHDAIASLAGDGRFRTALLTGNFARGAEIKLGHFDLWRHFAFGAYGDDHVNRRDLVPVAIECAAAEGWTPADIVVIGDTPLDVDCAHAHGAHAVAVATGHYSVEELVRSGADLVVPTLAALAPAHEALLRLCRAEPRRPERGECEPGRRAGGEETPRSDEVATTSEPGRV